MMNGDEADQRVFLEALREVMAVHGHGKLTGYSMIGILRAEVAWIELQITRTMVAELDRRQIGKVAPSATPKSGASK